MIHILFAWHVQVPGTDACHTHCGTAVSDQEHKWLVISIFFLSLYSDVFFPFSPSEKRGQAVPILQETGRYHLSFSLSFTRQAALQAG